LSNVLNSKPVEAADHRTIAELVSMRVARRVPVIAAGQVRTPEEARKALELGLSLVAVGQGLVMNPEWVELAISGEETVIETARRRRLWRRRLIWGF
jgi:2,4-dienoyl-CoA reductase-like NADH-dependent reductase (Old Yellow Enzyme family)